MAKQPSSRSKAPADEEKGKTNADSTLSGLKGDWAAIGLLMLLYTLQGIPMGLFGSVPFLMQQKKVSMLDQSQFSLAVWPFSLKLLWAPLVDSVYSGRVGRRKTWIVPAQLAIGVLLLWSSLHIDTWLGEGIDSADVDVGTLTKLFLAFYFLAATQDIAVDGLALTILSPRNKELGATCNAIGQSVGANVAYTGFLALYTYGYVTLGGFMSFWGGVFLLSTVWVAVAKGDEHEPLRGSVGSILTSAYGEMLTVLKLPAVRSMALVLLTAKAALGVFDAVVPLRLVEVGVPKEHLAMIASSMFPVMLLAQLYVSGKYFAGKDSKPLLIWLGCYPYRILLGVVSALIVVVVAHLSAGGGGGLPAWLYAVMFVAMAVGTVLNGTMFVAQMAFYNRVSDPAIGGTYMTMLNTISNLGSAWPTTAALYVVGKTTVTQCVPKACDASVVRALRKAATGADGCGCVDETVVDGFYVTCAISLAVGFLWFTAMRARVKSLQAQPPKAWLAPK